MNQLFIVDKWGKKRKAEMVVCGNCGVTLLMRTFSKRPNKYCSSACAHASRKNGKTIRCLQCNEDIYRSNFKIEQVSQKFCSRKCKELYQSGEKHPRWLGGKGTYRERALKRYGLSCSSKDNCPLRGVDVSKLRFNEYFFEVDHIDGNRNNNNIENLQVLCVFCHKLKTFGDIVLTAEQIFCKD